MNDSDSEKWKKRYLRAREARKDAEAILEEKSLELYKTNEQLREFSQQLEKTVAQRTEQLHRAIEQLQDEVTKRSDIAEQLGKARDEALKSADLKTDFLARMSHEIRTPLNAVIGLTSLLLDSDIDETQTLHLSTVRNSGRILLRLINDILDMSKIEANKLELEFAYVETDTLVEQPLSLIMLEATDKDMQFDVRRGPLVPDSILTDGGRVQQVLTNLLSNAVRYADGGNVTVETDISPEIFPATAAPQLLRDNPKFDPENLRHLCLTVSDHGIGIKKEQLDELFSPFTQFAGSTPGSSGLGLAICKRICERLGGDISVESEFGVGTSFTVRMLCCAPLSTQADDAVASTEAREVITSSERTGQWLLNGRSDLEKIMQQRQLGTTKPLSVLLADDYEVNRMVQHAQLEKLGYRADAVANGEEVLRALRARPYDVVLMDVRMPVMDGLEATRRIRENADGPQPFIAAVTASALQGDKETFEAAGMDAYVSKPVDLSELITVLTCAYDRKQDKAAESDTANSVESSVSLDLDDLYASLGDGAEQLLRQVIPVFLRELPGRVQRFGRSHKEDDCTTFTQLCHGLKGSSRSIGANDLAEICGQLETKGFAGEIATEDELARLLDTAERTRVALEAKFSEISIGETSPA